MSEFIYLPWPNIAAFFGACIGAITLVSLIAARIPRFAGWVGRPLKDLLGVTEILHKLDSLGEAFSSHSVDATLHIVEQNQRAEVSDQRDKADDLRHGVIKGMHP